MPGQSSQVGKLSLTSSSLLPRVQSGVSGGCPGQSAWAGAFQLPGQEGDQGPGHAEHEGDAGDHLQTGGQGWAQAVLYNGPFVTGSAGPGVI